ncbi:MAG: hypothetical protein KQJ78_11330 [Deltaproteobacteria bacterium]|nr:hypothetical protein [Deltaproteobacteria bacterium]
MAREPRSIKSAAEPSPESLPECRPAEPGPYSSEVTPWDEEAFNRIISIELSPVQVERVVTPARVFPRQEAVLAVHWHPEFIPLPLIERRINAMFPGREEELIIPTQHNEILSFHGYAGVEIDCYSRGFARKVQLLLHLTKEKAAEAGVLKGMCEHTFQYRSGQLYEYLDSLVDPRWDERMQEGAAETGANEDLVNFTRAHAARLAALLRRHESRVPRLMIKNKLLREYFDQLRGLYPDRMINRAQLLLKAVKATVKRNFSLTYFYRTHEVIEEARAAGAGIVIPHPEQFWPILLAGYDVDGYEVWNPQSREYTEFLINVLDRHNKSLNGRERPILVFMGDDTHLGEKVKDPALADREKVAREVGWQPAWDELAIAKTLILSGVDRRSIIQEYKERLA